MATIRATEAAYQQTIVEAAHFFGWLVHAERPAQRGNGRWVTAIQGDPGFPDLVLVHVRRERLLFIELKRKPNHPTLAQETWIAALQAAGAWARVLYVPEQMDEVLALLQGPQWG